MKRKGASIDFNPVTPSGWRWRGFLKDPVTLEPSNPWACQIKGFERHKDSHQGALFMKVGSGKTEVVWNIMERHRVAGRIKRGVFLTENGLCDDVLEQAKRCIEGEVYDKKFKKLADGATAVNVVASDARAARVKAIEQATANNAEYLIMNYEALISLLPEVLEFLGNDPYAVAVDESTNIKTWHAQRTKATCKLGLGAEYRYILTGTPDPQGPEDIFGQYLFADREIYGSHYVAFRLEFMRINHFKAIIGLKPEMHEEYYRRFHSIAYVPDPKDYHDIPPMIYEQVHYDLTPEEKRAYVTMKKEMLIEFKKGSIEARAANGMTKTLRLAQISSGFCGGLDEDLEKVNVKFKNPSKLKALESLVTSDRFQGSKFLVWCAWKQNVRDVMARLAKLGIKAVDYYGDTKDPRKNEQLFKNDKSVRAIVLGEHKGHKGLNLQGPDVKHEVFYTNTYSTLHRIQAEGRAHRGAIKHQVVCWDLIGRGTLDAGIVHGHKKNINFQEILMRSPEKFFNGEY